MTRIIKTKELRLASEVEQSISGLVDSYNLKHNRYQFILSDIAEAVRLSAQYPLTQLDTKQAIVRGLSSYIHGALGEQKVVKALENLSDDYYLINDFTISFLPPIYNRNERDFIKSIQIDHVLIGPSGVFLLETKNWSEKSIDSHSLRSPIEQVKRASFALFKLLNNEMSNYQLGLERHHWGDKKLSIRNVVVLINTKPKEEFQYVKVLTVDELIGYVTYFKPYLSRTEIQRIAEFLLNIRTRVEA